MAVKILSRAQRRSNKDIKALLTQQALMTTKENVDIYSAAVALACRDELEFGRARTLRFMEKVDSIFSAILEDRITIEDVKKTVEEELDITFD